MHEPIIKFLIKAYKSFIRRLSEELYCLICTLWVGEGDTFCFIHFIFGHPDWLFPVFMLSYARRLQHIRISLEMSL